MAGDGLDDFRLALAMRRCGVVGGNPCGLLAPQAPVVFYNLVWLLVPVPAVVLARRVLEPPFWRSLYALVVVLTFLPFRAVLEAVPLADRVALIVQCLVLGGVLLRDLVRGRFAEYETLAQWRSVGQGFIWLNVVLLATAVGAAVTGSVGVARFLTGLSLGALGIGLVIRCAFHVLDGIVRAALDTRLAQVSRVTLLAGALGVGIGFGLQNVVNNFVSGLIMLFERPVQVGDTIEVGGLMGEVRRIGIRSSTVRTYPGAEVVVPNADLIAKDGINWTMSDRHRRLEIDVGVAYGSEPEGVTTILREVAGAHPRVLPYPEPVVVFTAFGARSLDFRLLARVRFESSFAVQSDLRRDILRRFAEAGIAIPFPQRDVRVYPAT